MTNSAICILLQLNRKMKKLKQHFLLDDCDSPFGSKILYFCSVAQLKLNFKGHRYCCNAKNWLFHSSSRLLSRHSIYFFTQSSSIASSHVRLRTVLQHWQGCLYPFTDETIDGQELTLLVQGIEWNMQILQKACRKKM